VIQHVNYIHNWPHLPRLDRIIFYLSCAISSYNH